MIREGSQWQIGNGASVSVWKDDWFPKGLLKWPVTTKLVNCPIIKVKDLPNLQGKG